MYLREFFVDIPSGADVLDDVAAGCVLVDDAKIADSDSSVVGISSESYFGVVISVIM